MCSERYADERRLGLRKYQLPPTSSDASKHVCSMPLSRSALQETSPLTPAPMTHTCMTREVRPPLGSRAPMRFFEYEAREIVKRAGIPVTDYGFTKDPLEARDIAERIGGPVVIKSQVLTGGRMKAGGVQFADRPDEAERHA